VNNARGCSRQAARVGAVFYQWLLFASAFFAEDAALLAEDAAFIAA
jgi:hypothetical protein